MGSDESQTALIDDAARARLALSPIRKRLLAALREPGSATTLAEALDLPRQRIGYHLRTLEKAGLDSPTRQRSATRGRAIRRRGYASVLTC